MTVIDALNDTAKSLTNLAKVLIAVGEQTKGEPAKDVLEVEAKEMKSSVTLEQIRGVLSEKSQAGLTGKVKELLDSFGANKLSAVKPEDYEKLLLAAKALK